MKKLYRSPDGVIGGVCGGLADYFEIDPVIVRLIALLLLMGGIGFIPYLLLWLVTPEEY